MFKAIKKNQIETQKITFDCINGIKRVRGGKILSQGHEVL